MRSTIALFLAAGLSLLNISAGSRPAPAAQAEPPVMVEAYWELVGATQQALAEMEALPAGDVRRQLDELAREWETVTAVEFPDGGVVTVDSSRLVANLRADPPDPERLLGLTNALLDAHAQYPQEVFTVQDIEPLREILARPEFQWEEARAAETPGWLQWLFDRYADFIEWLAYGLQNTVYYGRVPLMIAAALLLTLGLLYISRNLSRSLVREAELAGDGSGEDALL